MWEMGDVDVVVWHGGSAMRVLGWWFFGGFRFDFVLSHLLFLLAFSCAFCFEMGLRKVWDESLFVKQADSVRICFCACVHF